MDSENIKLYDLTVRVKDSEGVSRSVVIRSLTEQQADQLEEVLRLFDKNYMIGRWEQPRDKAARARIEEKQ